MKANPFQQAVQRTSESFKKMLFKRFSKLTLFNVLGESCPSFDKIPRSVFVFLKQIIHISDITQNKSKIMAFMNCSAARSLLYLSFLSVPTDSASFPDGCKEREVTWPLWHKHKISTNGAITEKPPQLGDTYMCALMDFKHSHVFVLHTQRRPSSPPLSKWDVEPNSRHEIVPSWCSNAPCSVLVFML